MSIFSGGATQAPNRNLVEFKAGKMNLRGNMVHPDKRKGLVYLYQGNDMLMHLCWKDRSNNSLEENLVIFPDEVEFKKVTQNTTGRVYVLKWKSNTRKLFFWMQEPKDDKDEEYCKKINDLLNHPPAPGFDDDDDDDDEGSTHPLQPLMARMAGGGAGGIDPNDLANVLRGMNPNEFASLLSSFSGGGGAAGLMQGLQRGGGAQRTLPSRPNTAPAETRSVGTTTSRSGGSSTRPRNGGSNPSSATVPSNTAKPPTSSGSKNAPIQMSSLTSVFANLGNNTMQETQGATSIPNIDLCDITASENLIPLLSNKDIQDKLRVYLSEDNLIPKTQQELKDSIQSPEFRRIVSAFSTALQSGELNSILTQFNFPDDVTNAANQGDLQAFAQALEKHYKTSNNEKDN